MQSNFVVASYYPADRRYRDRGCASASGKHTVCADGIGSDHAARAASSHTKQCNTHLTHRAMGLLEPLGTAENVLLFEHDTEHTSGIRTQNATLCVRIE